MTNDPKPSCTGEITAEILMFTTSIFTMSFTQSFFSTVARLYTRSHTKARTRSLQDQNLFLSAAYALFLPLMSYLFSQAKQYNREGRASTILIWMVYVEIIRIHGDVIFTWELKRSAEQLVRLFWVGFLVFTYSPFYDIRACLITLCIVYGAFEVMKVIIFHQASDSYLIGKNPEVIDSHMKKVMLQDHRKTTPMSICDYIVMGEENQEVILCNNGYLSDSNGIITIGRVVGLRSREDEAFTSQHPYWRDTCLSLALAKMLRRRFAKLSLQEAGCTKARDFVLKGLIEFVGSSQNMQTDGNSCEKEPVERLFGIIREELKFVSEFLYIKVPICTYFEKKILVHVIQFFTAGLVAGSGVYLQVRVANISFEDFVQHANNYCFFQNSRYGFLLIFITNFLDILITSFLHSACIYTHYTAFAIAPWSNVRSIRKYLKDPAKWYKYYTLKTSILAKLPSPLAYYYEPMVFPRAQEKYRKQTGRVHSSSLDMKPETIFFCIKVDLSTLVRLPKWISKNIPRKIPLVFHSTDAKEAVLRSFTNSGGQLTNGETSLRNHDMEHLNWAFQTNIGSNTKAILVWHIATTLFQHHEFPSEQNNNPHQEPPIQQTTDFLRERAVALELSNYCYYLVAYFPELLPDHVEWTKVKYESVIKEILAMDLSFNKKPTGKDRCNYALQAQWGGESSVADDGTSLMVKKGAKLVEDLIKCAENGTPVWKMLAEFWVEMMLFIAPSDNVEGHTKILHREELITQLWALLTHAGILTRPRATEHHDHVRENNEVTGDVNV